MGERKENFPMAQGTERGQEQTRDQSERAADGCLQRCCNQNGGQLTASSSLIGWMWLVTQRIRAQLVLQLGHTLSAELDRGGRWDDFRADSSGQAPVDWQFLMPCLRLLSRQSDHVSQLPGFHQQ